MMLCYHYYCLVAFVLVCLLNMYIRFLLEQYLSGTLFLKPASMWIPSPDSRHSSVTRPDQCAHPHCRDTRKWSDDY